MLLSFSSSFLRFFFFFLASLWLCAKIDNDYEHEHEHEHENNRCKGN